MKQYIAVWLQLMRNSFGNVTTTKIDSFGYIAGKIIRLIGFFVLISSLFYGTKTFGGYTKYEALLFFLTFFLLDTITQVVFRGVYAFRATVRRGNFDFFLVKPISTLFLVMSQIIDFLDILFLIPITGLWIWVIAQIPAIDVLHVVSFTLFALISVVFMTAIHIIVAATTIVTAENQHVIWLYRETMRLGQFPPTIFPGILQLILTYIFPIIIIVAFPTKALLGELYLVHGVLALGIAILFFSLSVWLWQASVKKYSSASS